MGDGTVRCSSGAGPDLVDMGLSEVQALVAGALHHCALRSDGTVWCWGSNTWGALGDPSLPTNASRAAPTKVPGLANVVRIHTRDSYDDRDITCTLDRFGEVICWGGDWPFTPRREAALAGSREIAVADFTVCGIRDVAAIRCAYDDGSFNTYLLNDRVVDITSQYYTISVRTELGDVFFMGAGGRPAPLPVPELAGSKFFASGLGQVCAMLPDGTVGCTPGTEGRVFKERCEGTDVIDLQADGYSLCALHADGTINCGTAF
jgi:hypothetical protein